MNIKKIFLPISILLFTLFACSPTEVINEGEINSTDAIVTNVPAAPEIISELDAVEDPSCGATEIMPTGVVFTITCGNIPPSFGFFYNSYSDGTVDFQYVYGLYLNETDQPMMGVTLEINFFDAQDQLLGTNTVDITQDILRPGDYGTFDATINVSGFANIVVTANGDIASDSEVSQYHFDLVGEVDILDVDESGNTSVTGRVQNQGQVAADNVTVIAVLYTETNGMVGIIRDDIEGAIKPGEEITFVLDSIYPFLEATHILVFVTGVNQ